MSAERERNSATGKYKRESAKPVRDFTLSITLISYFTAWGRYGINGRDNINGLSAIDFIILTYALYVGAVNAHLDIVTFIITHCCYYFI